MLRNRDIGEQLFPTYLVVALTLLLALGNTLPPTKFFASPEHCLPLHSVLEFLALTISAMVFSLAWNLAMQEHVPDEMLSRAYSYDALGSFVAIPLGQLAFGPLGNVFGVQDVMLVSGVVYVLICAAALTSRSVRDLGRATEVVSTTSQQAH